MEHRRPGGWGQGYYCMNCGGSGCNMIGSGHYDHSLNKFVCVANPELVATLKELNK